MAQDKNQDDAEKWQKRFHIADSAQQPLFKRVEKFYDILYAVFNTDNMAPWRSKVYVPTLASKAWDLISRLSAIQPIFTVSIENELENNPETGEIGFPQEVLDRAEKIGDKLEDDFEHTHGEPMKLKLFNTLVDSVVAGTGFAKVTWCTENQKRRARPVDEMGMVDLNKEIVKEQEIGYNEFEPLNFFNVFVAPHSTGFYEAPWLIVRHYTTKSAAKDSGLYDAKAIDSLIESSPSANQFSVYNQARNRVLNTRDMNDETVDNICLYECYDPDGSVYVYGEGGKGVTSSTSESGKGDSNAWVKVRTQTDQYWHGMYPIVPFYTRKRSFSPYGESLFENNSRMQSAVNDLFNHYLDNWNLSIDSMLIYEDNSLQNDFVVEPGGEIIYTGEKPDQFKFPEPNPQQLSVVMGVLNQAIEAATVPQYLSGVPDSDLDKTQGTATGVKSITDAATEKIGFFRDNYKQSMKLVGKMWLSNLQQFMDTPAEIRRVQKGKLQAKLLMPGDVQGEMDLEIDDDSMIPVTKEQRRQTQIDLTSQLVGIQKAAIQQYELFKDLSDVPRYNFTEIAEDLADLFAVKEAQKYFETDKQAPQQPPNAPSEKIIESINFKDLPPDSKQAQLQQAGLPPSQALEAELQTTQAQAAQSVQQAQQPQLPVQPGQVGG